MLYAFAAFGYWGFMPIIIKTVSHVTPMEVMVHRVIWTVVFTLLLIGVGRDWGALKKALSDKKVLRQMGLSTSLLAVNWYVYIYAIDTDRVLQTSLGYFINPLMNVVLGMIFLRERLPFLQIVAVALAALGTMNLIFNYGELPWIALVVAGTFGIYGLIRKTVSIEAVQGLFVETTLILPFALGYLIHLMATGKAAFGAVNLSTDALLVLIGPITALPLILFTCAARRLPLYILGLIQYIAPTAHLFIAVFMYKEPFTTAHFITFAFIWTALAVFAWDSIRRRR